MAYQALKRIKLGDRWFRPGEEVPADLDRDWGRLVRQDMVVEVSGRGKKAGGDEKAVKALEAECGALKERVADLEQQLADAAKPAEDPEATAAAKAEADGDKGASEAPAKKPSAKKPAAKPAAKKPAPAKKPAGK